MHYGPGADRCFGVFLIKCKCSPLLFAHQVQFTRSCRKKVVECGLMQHCIFFCFPDHTVWTTNLPPCSPLAHPCSTSRVCMRFPAHGLPVAVVKLIVFPFSEKLHDAIWSLVLYLVMQCTVKSGAVLVKSLLVLYLVMLCTRKKWCSTHQIILFLLTDDNGAAL